MNFSTILTLIPLIAFIGCLPEKKIDSNLQEIAVHKPAESYFIRITAELDTFLKISDLQSSDMELGKEKCTLYKNSTIQLRAHATRIKDHFKIVLGKKIPGCELQEGFVFAQHVAEASLASDLKNGQAAKHVAILGDSQAAGSYGARLGDLIRNNTSAKLNFFGSACSAQIYHWVKGGFTAIPSSCFQTCESNDNSPSCPPTMSPGMQTKRIASILSNHPKIDLFIITLGDNHFGSNSTITSDVPLLLNPILSEPGRSCVWVTPTRGLGKFANKESLIKTLMDALAGVKAKWGRGCTIVDSYHLGKDVVKTDSDMKVMNDSLESDPMKLHPQGAGAKLWADRVIEKLLRDGILSSP
jgi:hypothetical protein